MLFFRIFELQTFRQIQDVTTEVATSSLRFKLHHGRIPYLEPQATAEDCIGKIQKNGHKQRKPLYKWGDPTSIHEFCCFMFLFWSTLSESKKDSNASDLKICTERCKAAKWRRKTRYHWLRGVEMTSSKTYQVLAIPLCPMLPCVPQFKAIGSGNLPTANFHKSLVPWNARQIRLPRVSPGYHTYISCDWRCPKYELQLPTRLWIGIPNSCQDAALCLVFLKQFPSMESHQFLLAKGTSLENCSLIHQRGNQESKKDMAIDISRLWLPFLSASTDARLRFLMLSYAVSCWFASQLSSPPSFWRTKRPRPSDLQRITQLSTNVHDFWKSLDEPFDSLSPGRRAPLLCKIHSDKAIWWCFPFHASWAQKKTILLVFWFHDSPDFLVSNQSCFWSKYISWAEHSAFCDEFVKTNSSPRETPPTSWDAPSPDKCLEDKFCPNTKVAPFTWQLWQTQYSGVFLNFRHFLSESKHQKMRPDSFFSQLAIANSRCCSGFRLWCLMNSNTFKVPRKKALILPNKQEH